MRFLKNTHNKGFSIIEVLIATAMLAIVTAGVATFFTNLLSSTKLVEQKMEISELKNSLTSILMDPPTCSIYFFKSANPYIVPVDFSDVDLGATGLTKGPNPNDLLLPAVTSATGTALPGSSTGLKVSSIKLRNITSLNTNLISATLEVNFTNTQIQLKPIRITEVFNTSGTGPFSITGCNAPMTASLCSSLGGSFNPVNSSCSQGQAECTAIGGTYDGSVSPPCTLPMNSIGQNTCEAAGGIWNPMGSPKCTLNNIVQNSISGACAAIGGIYNPNAVPPNQICSLPTPNMAPIGGCDSSTEYLVGFDPSTGAKVCRSTASLVAAASPAPAPTPASTPALVSCPTAYPYYNGSRYPGLPQVCSTMTSGNTCNQVVAPFTVGGGQGPGTSYSGGTNTWICNNGTWQVQNCPAPYGLITGANCAIGP